MHDNINPQIQIVLNEVENNINHYNSFVLAFSGGLDSTVLLDIITLLRSNYNNKNSKKKYNLSFRAIHIYHGLNPMSNNWIYHCRNECKTRNVKFDFITVNFNKLSKNIEESARIARYSALYSSLLDGEVLLTAHHKNDQAETLLLALKRGSGPKGLSSMSLNTKFYSYRLIRPLLNFTKEELKRYAKIRKLNWIEDASNRDLRFDRNFLRLKILPLIYKRWPGFASTASRSARICAEQEQLLDELLSKTLNKIIQLDGSLCLMELKNMSYIKRFALLRRWLSMFDINMPSRKKLDLIWKEVALSKYDSSDAQIQINDRQQIRRFRNRLYIVSLCPKILLKEEMIFYLPKIKQSLKLPLDLGFLFSFITKNTSPMNEIKCLSFKDFLHENKKTNSICNKYFNIQKVNFNFYNYQSSEYITKLNLEKKISKTVIRSPMDDEKVSIRFGLKLKNNFIHIIGKNRYKMLKKILQELNVPPWERKRIPMLFYNERLISALGLFITIDGKINKFQKQLNLYWIKNIY